MIRGVLSICVRLVGLVMVIATCFAFFSIIFFNPSDPNKFHANNNEVTNIMGPYGSTIADICLQSCGYAIFFPLLFFMIAGLRMVRANWPNHLIIRLSLMLIVLPALCGAFYYIPLKIAGSISYGGYLGSYVMEEVSVVFAEDIVPYLLGGISIVGIFLSLGLTLKEWGKFNVLIYRVIAGVVIFIGKTFGSGYTKVKSWVVRVKSEELDDEEDEDYKQTGSSISEHHYSVANPDSALEVNEERPPVKKAAKAKNNLMRSLPSINLLQMPPESSKSRRISKDILEQSVTDLKQVLKDFGIKGEIVNISPGPVVTLYELEPAAGTKSSRVVGLADDISRSMSAVSTRIAVIPGKNAIGIELPNVSREIVYLRELVEDGAYSDSRAILPLALGKNIAGEVVVADLAKMPHLLVAGTTGSGKSVAINTMILSLLYNHTPDTCRLVMIDPKMLELSIYEGIPHLISPVVTDPKKAVIALKWVVREMEERYRSMSTLGVRNIDGYNKALKAALESGKKLTKQIQTGFDKATGEPIFETVEMSSAPLPHIVVIVDEMADLMLVAGKEIESLIQRLAQMARAAGIHIIMATQRPSVDVITGVIKANFPTRISFQVTSKIDSRTILGEQGAEQLLGMGDMLYMVPGGRIERIHGAFVDDREVEAIVNFLKEQSPPNYAADITEEDESEEGHGMPTFSSGGEDDLYNQAVSIVLKDKKVSTSYIQRVLRIGYNKAAILVERMEKEGIISAPNHIGKREIL